MDSGIVLYTLMPYHKRLTNSFPLSRTLEIPKGFVKRGNLAKQVTANGNNNSSALEIPKGFVKRGNLAKQVAVVPNLYTEEPKNLRTKEPDSLVPWFFSSSVHWYYWDFSFS